MSWNNPLESWITPSGVAVWASIGHESIVSLMKRTDPSAMAKLAPPGWKLDAAPM